MKKTLLNFAAIGGMLVLLNSETNAQWLTTGNATAATGFLGSTTNFDLSLITNNTSRMYITKTGNIGIGTNTPAFLLDVFSTGNASANFKSSTGTANLIIDRGNNTATSSVSYRTAGVPTWQTGTVGTDNFAIRNIALGSPSLTVLASNNNVGIGTNAPAQKLDVAGNIQSSGTVYASGGNSALWNAAYGWGNHATAGYLTAETDPQVGSNTVGYVPTWNGSSLNTSNIYATGSFVGINTATGVGAGNFIVKSPYTSGYGGMYIVQDGTSGRKPFYGYSCTGGQTAWTELDEASSNFQVYNNGYNFVISNTGRVGIGTTTPTANRLEAAGTSSSEPVVNVTNSVTGINVDVRGISSTSVTNPGYGYGAYATGGYMGVYAFADATTYAGAAYGVYGTASGSAGTRYGVYGYASGTGDNWGGFFPTKTYTSELRVGGTQGATGYVAAINGKLIAEEVRVELKANWPDYVFSKEHNLMSIEDLETSVNTNSHLPGVPSACEVEENGIMLGEMQTKTMEKLEENTLYIIQLNNKIKELEKKIEALTNNK